MKIGCGGCAEPIDSKERTCPHCGHIVGSNARARRKAFQGARKRSKARHAIARGGGALHVTKTNKATRVSGGLPSLGKRK